MFESLKAQEQQERLSQAVSPYEEGIAIYKAFLGAVETQDKVRASRLALRLDTWQNALSEAQRADFAALLVKRGIIPADSELGKAIKLFNGSLKL